MKNNRLLFIVVLLVAIAAAVYLHHKPTVQPPASVQTAQNPAPPAPTTTVRPSVASAPAPVSNPASGMPAVITASNNPVLSKYPADIVAKYRQGLISKDEAMQEIVLAKNKQSQDFYGKVIDQTGEPVAGVNVTGNLTLEQGIDSDEKFTTYTTLSDADGLFQFTGLIGAQLGVTVQKQGYLMGARGEGYKQPVGGITTPYERAVLTMWKLKGPEPLVNTGFEAKIPSDGTSVTLDMATGAINPGGDLRVTLLRSPLEVRRSGQLFDWSIKIEMLHGGLIAENDDYPYWAPEGGYQPLFQANTSTNSVPWNSKLTQNFYIKSAGGQFGRMLLTVHAALTPARARFDLTLNPSGSQNLEPSP